MTPFNPIKYLKPLLLLMLLAAIFPVAAQQEVSTVRIKLIPALGEAVNIKSDANNIISTGIIPLDRVNAKYAVVGMKRVFRYSPRHELRHKKYGLHLWYDLEVNGAVNPDALMNDFAALKEITKVELKEAPQLIDPSKPVIYSEKVKMKSAKITDLPFNDPMLDKQWHYHNYGQTGGTPGADIGLFKAWEKATGSPNVIVSVHDQGVDYTHEDLKDAMWTNLAELNGRKNVDDDGNGYIDDIYGYDYVKKDGNIEPGYHGTHVAGTVAATNNNGKGVAGVAGGSGNNDGVRIMSLRILGADPSNVAESFVYAADNGAVISQNSWGFTNPDMYSDAIHEAIDYFIAEAGNYPGSPMKGGVVIFATGNTGLEGKFYPAAYEPVISVTATGSQNIIAPYSNYGTWVDIAAPGGNLGDDPVLTGKDKSYSNGVLSTLDNNQYGYLDGTSMACPHVSGVAALIASKFQSSTFTNSELLVHLLTGYNDSLYQIEYNEPFIGMLGRGVTDANTALDTDNKIPPHRVSNLALTGRISQDFVEFTWTVPSDEDDRFCTDYEVLYSESPLTAQNIGKAQTYKFQNLNEIGDTLSYEINNLKPTTTYHFAVRYIDRWGNKAGLSNPISATTNAGPVVTYHIDTLSVAIDVRTDNPVYTDSILLVNQGEGVLRWDLEARYSEGIPYSVSHTRNLTPVPMEAYSGKRTVLRSVPQLPIQAFNIEKENNEEYSDLYSDNQIFVLGETDINLPNSAATRYVVSHAEGFNLTHIDTYYEIDDTATKAILEIFKGPQIQGAKRLLSQVIDQPSNLFTRIQLKEQLFFTEGEVFWVVLHIPPGNLYPLGAGFENTPEGSQNAYMSFDYGKSWALIEDIIPDDNVVWAVYAMSRYKKIDTYLELSPKKGELFSGDSVYISARVDAEFMVDGNYRGNVLVNTNEAERENFRIPVDLHITGHDPFIQAPARVDFGNVLLGYEKTQMFALKNTGLSRFDVEEPFFEFSNPQFTYVQGVNTEFDAGDTQEIYFKYTPDTPGLTVAYATILDKNGDHQTFELIGVGLEPPVVKLEPENASYPEVAIGDTVKGSFVIKNEGKFTLDYYMPTFADGQNMENIPQNIHRFGYRTNIYTGEDNPKYAWTDISETGVDATNAIMSSSSSIRNIPHVKVDFGFNFPFFGSMEDSVLITSYGMLMFDLHHHMWTRTPLFFNYERNADRWISAFGSIISLAMDESSRIYYQKYPDKLIVQYNNANVNDELAIIAKVTFQMVLHENGNIYFQYKQSEIADWWWDWGPGRFDISILDIGTMVGIQDRYLDDGVYIHDSDKRTFPFSAKSTIEFINPGLGLFYDVSQTFGALKPGDADTIHYKINTDSLFTGKHSELLNIITNDAKNILIPHGALLDITKGASPELALSTDTLDFGEVFIGDTVTHELTLYNAGRAGDWLEAFQSSAPFKILGQNLPYPSGPKKKINLNVQVTPTQLGAVEKTVAILTRSGLHKYMVVKATVVPAPSISLNPGSIHTPWVPSGDSLIVQVVVSNPGDNTLEFGMIGNEWVQVSPAWQQPMQNTAFRPEYDYLLSKSTEENGPHYDWYELAETGEGIALDIDPYVNNFTEPIALPFSFNYYGQMYDSLIISANGFVAFDHTIVNKDVQWDYGGTNIPNADVPNNFIAPMWFGGGFAYPVYYPLTGVYYKLFPDHIIVEWKHIMNGFEMGDPLTFQVILHENGYIKFQYKFEENAIDFNMRYAAVGIENQDGSKGIQISHNNPVVNKDMSILFTPIEMHQVAAGQSLPMNVLLDASHLYHNAHVFDLQVPNNAPNGKNLSVPITFNVFGTGETTVTDSIDFGTHMVLSGPGNKHTRTFEIENSGTAHLYLTKLQQQFPQDFEVEAYLEVPNSMTGELEYLWTPIMEPSETTSSKTPITIKAGTALPMRVHFAPNSGGDFYDELVIKNSIRNHNGDTVRFYANAIMPPIIEVDTTYFETYAVSDASTDNKTVMVSNAGHGANLTYTIEVEYAREPTAQTQPYSNRSMLYAGAMMADFSVHQVENRARFKSAQTELFNRVLTHENAGQSDINLGFGGGYVLKAATKFVAPEDGFNLSHVQVWYAPGELLKSSFTINVYSSAGLNSTGLVYTQNYQHVVDAPDTDGKLITVELHDPVLFFPEETFYIEIHYDKEQLYPQGLAKIDAPKPATFFFGNGAQYFDMSESDFAEYAWILRAAELEFAGSTWIVFDGPTQNSLEAGQNHAHPFKILAEYADDGINTAYIHFLSNDPVQPDKTVQVVLNHNAGPKFEVERLELSVLENDTLSFAVKATDVENDPFTIDFVNAPAFIQTQKNNNELILTCTPQFEDEGIYTLQFEGNDAHFNRSKMKVLLQVLNKNRAPKANEIETIVIGLDEKAAAIKGTDLFTDPDGDALQLNYVEDLNAIFRTYVSGDDYLIEPLELGESTLKFIATDAAGQTAVNFVNIRVTSQGNSIKGSGYFEPYPNPTSDVLYFSTDKVNIIRTNVSITNMLGSIVKVVEVNVNDARKASVDVSDLPPGIYTLSVKNSTGRNNFKFSIKR